MRRRPATHSLTSPACADTPSFARASCSISVILTQQGVARPTATQLPKQESRLEHELHQWLRPCCMCSVCAPELCACIMKKKTVIQFQTYARKVKQFTSNCRCYTGAPSRLQTTWKGLDVELRRYITLFRIDKST